MKNNERKIDCGTGVIDVADGSAFWEIGIYLIFILRSCFFFLTFIGDTKVLCSVSGPTEVRSRDEKYDEATLEVILRPLEGQQSMLYIYIYIYNIFNSFLLTLCTGLAERWLERKIDQAIRPLLLLYIHPRSLVQVVIQVVSKSDDYSRNMFILLSAINAASLALLDSGIPMKSCFASEVFFVTRKDGELESQITHKKLDITTAKVWFI